MNRVSGYYKDDLYEIEIGKTGRDTHIKVNGKEIGGILGVLIEIVPNFMISVTIEKVNLAPIFCSTPKGNMDNWYKNTKKSQIGGFIPHSELYSLHSKKSELTLADIDKIIETINREFKRRF